MQWCMECHPCINIEYRSVFKVLCSFLFKRVRQLLQFWMNIFVKTETIYVRQGSGCPLCRDGIPLSCNSRRLSFLENLQMLRQLRCKGK